MKISLFLQENYQIKLRKMLVHSQHKSCALLQRNRKWKIEDMCHPCFVVLTSFSQVCRKGFDVCILIFLCWLKTKSKQNTAWKVKSSTFFSQRMVKNIAFVVTDSFLHKWKLPLSVINTHRWCPGPCQLPISEPGLASLKSRYFPWLEEKKPCVVGPLVSLWTQVNCLG